MNILPSMTDNEWFSHQIQLQADLRNQILKKPCNGEYAKQKVLDPLGQEFPFQCSCGVIHLFSYTETPEGQRVLTVK
ncbi:MAG: hypothetical protein WA121_10595 [Syntrophales bacterium]